MEDGINRKQFPVTVVDILSRTVSELSQLIVQILVTSRFWATRWGA